MQGEHGENLCLKALSCDPQVKKNMFKILCKGAATKRAR